MTTTAMDIIFITDLRADAIIGIYEKERNIKQTLNYKLLSKRVEAYIQQSEFQLIETLAERLAQLILNEFQVPWLKLTLHKVGALSNSGDVGVRIVRTAT